MIKSLIAINAGKATASLVSRLHLGAGTNLPGKIARKLDPQLLSYLGRQIRQQTLAITGTNGKTTTSGLIVQFLREAGHSVVHNQLGANMIPGITAALVSHSSPYGKLTADYGVLEVDEASLKGIASEMAIQQVLVTNLFRDQLDRYGELDTTGKLILAGIRKTEGQVLLNADDPLVAALGLEIQDAQYYGIESVSYAHAFNMDFPVSFPNEVTDCHLCGGTLRYDTVFFGHLGRYHCEQCGYSRPKPVVYGENIQVHSEGSEITLRYGSETILIHLNLPGLFNAYNFIAAAAQAYLFGLPVQVLQTGLDHYQSVFGRAERKIIDQKTLLIMLIKNPVGASEVLKLVGGDPKGRLLIALNDNYADGRDVSWIWDACFEVLDGYSKPIVVSGVRASDMATRLKYAGVDPSQLIIEDDLKSAVRIALDKTPQDETLYILPTYTALLSLRNII